jgi:glycosyltransferase involved in cell wall biosynthesis
VSRILVLLPSDPSSLDSGARIRNAGLIELLREAHQVDTVVARVPRRSTIHRFADIALTDLPDMAQRLWLADIASAVRNGDYDAVQAEGVEMARYLFAAPPERRIYDAHNAEFLLQQRLAQTSSGLRSAYSRLQWQRLRRFEGKVVRNSRMSLAVSEHDANQLLALAGDEANVHVVPNAIHVAAYPFHTPTSEVPAHLLFVGKLGFRPNANALKDFASDVLPRIQIARLFVVGGEPPDWLVKLGQHDSRIAVTDYVADERPYFERAAALILPIRTGGGSRFKALIAMASGVPIISTRLGMEGLEAEPGTHYLAAESPDEWVDSVKRVFEDAELRRTLVCNGRALVEERYDWSAVRGRVQSAYAWLDA